MSNMKKKIIDVLMQGNNIIQGSLCRDVDN